MSWSRIKHNGNGAYKECSRCEHLFSTGEVAYKRNFAMGDRKHPDGSYNFAFYIHTEIVCESCKDKCGLVVTKDLTKKKGDRNV